MTTVPSTPTGTLATNALHDFWLPAFETECSAAERLRAMWARRKDGPDTAALLEGWLALAAVSKETAEQIRKRGGILFAWHGSAALQQGGAA